MSLFSPAHTKDITYSFLDEKIYDAVVRQDISAHVHHSDVSGQSGFDARKHALQVKSTMSVWVKVENMLCRLRTATMKT